MYGLKHTYYSYKLPNATWLNFLVAQLLAQWQFLHSNFNSLISLYTRNKYRISGFEDAHLYTQRCLYLHREMYNSKKQQTQQNILQLKT